MNVDDLGNYDFSGIATAYGIKCVDGRTIQKGAFKKQHGQRVPLVWQHQRNQTSNILGHVILMHEDSGMRAYAFVNNTTQGNDAKELVRNKDIEYFSIYAVRCVQHNKSVSDGDIIECSLVLGAGNPGAKIDDVIMHSNDPFEDDMILDGAQIIQSGHKIEFRIEHNKDEDEEDEEDETLQDIVDSMNSKQQSLLQGIIEHSLEFSLNEGNKITVEESYTDIWNTFTEKQKNAVVVILEELNELEHGDGNMTQNIFTKNKEGNEPKTMSHDDQKAFLERAKTSGMTLRHYVEHVNDNNTLEHAGTYGIDSVGELFPEYKDVHGGRPMWHHNPAEWVEELLKAVSKRPFMKIKSMYADLTADEARARGYIKGNLKVEQVFPVLKRVTTGSMIYVKQAMDREEIIEITDFNVVAWIKEAMRLMLRKEIARAILISDGRAIDDDDKIGETTIRPVLKDAALYAVRKQVALNTSVADYIDEIIRAHDDYRGDSAPVLYCTPSFLTDMLLLKDGDGRYIYDTQGQLARKLRVSKIVTIHEFDGVSYDSGGGTHNLKAIMLNPSDYVIGMNPGGKTTYFDDFDIDYNKYKYLYETMMSGALVAPMTAIVIEESAT